MEPASIGLVMSLAGIAALAFLLLWLGMPETRKHVATTDDGEHLEAGGIVS